MAQPILAEYRGPFLELTLNRPRSGNTLSPKLMLRLAELLDTAAERSDLKAVILRGNGPDFCLGRDSKAGRSGPPKTAFEAHQTIMGRILGVYTAFRRCPVPVVAAVRGRAVGFGCGLVGAADIAICEETSTFALPEMKSGIPPTLVISALARVARKAVADLVYSCRTVDAEYAHRVGLVSQVVAPGDMEAAVTELLSALRGYDSTAINIVKGFLDKPALLDPDSLSDLAGYTLATAFTRPR